LTNNTLTKYNLNMKNIEYLKAIKKYYNYKKKSGDKLKELKKDIEKYQKKEFSNKL